MQRFRTASKERPSAFRPRTRSASRSRTTSSPRRRAASRSSFSSRRIVVYSRPSRADSLPPIFLRLRCKGDDEGLEGTDLEFRPAIPTGQDLALLRFVGRDTRSARRTCVRFNTSRTSGPTARKPEALESARPGPRRFRRKGHGGPHGPASPDRTSEIRRFFFAMRLKW